ncbi:uncharacterized protein LOC108214475 [Daucus carota subsp. sativus]|uniref:uncharacterized protein LOC108214475 n=1 Tax=Daucus carota subsp. sativus TaxID=79200 RepID=UPI003083C954
MFSLNQFFLYTYTYPSCLDRNRQMEFVKHNHPLILDENFYGGEEEACYLCKGRLRSQIIHSVYRCSSRSDGGNIADENVDCVKLFVHKSCAELPLKMTDYYKHPQHPITLVCPKLMPYNHRSQLCSLCFWPPPHTVVYSCESCDLTLCLQCVTCPIVYHPSHNQHALVLVERMATFLCDACGLESGGFSSCKCSTCPFWIHTDCAILSSSRKFQFHTHPLLLAYSFPQQYLNFKRKCLICKQFIVPTQWIYYCAGCRIFLHIDCATRNPKTTMRCSRWLLTLWLDSACLTLFKSCRQVAVTILCRCRSCLMVLEICISSLPFDNTTIV